MKNVLIFVALLLVAVFSVTIADARDCTTCPNNEQCTAPLPPTKVIAKECDSGQCYRPLLIPRIKVVEKECTVVEKKTEKKTACSAAVVCTTTTKARWSEKCGRRGIQRLAHRPLLRNIGWRLRHIGCHRQ